MSSGNTISFYFRGWVEIDAKELKCSHVERSNAVVTSRFTLKELVDKLNAGEFALALGDYLYDNRDAEIEISDFEVA